MTIQKSISYWATLPFDVNPYGDNLPSWLLDTPMLMKKQRTSADAKCLRELNQNGNVLCSVVNDDFKISSAERKNFVIFSEIFKKCYDNNTLCPANYIAEVLKTLDEKPIETYGEYPFDFYIGTVARSIRAFASYLREIVLKEIIENFLITNNMTYTMFNVDSEMDSKEKTDIFFIANSNFYRVWSYQATDIGCVKTNARILSGAKNGINILMPFNRFDKICKNTNGWDIYDESETEDYLFEIFSKEPLLYSDVKEKIQENFKFITKPVAFLVHENL